MNNEITEESLVCRVSSIDFIGRLQSRDTAKTEFYFNIIVSGQKYVMGIEFGYNKEKVSNARKKLIEAMMKSEDNHERFQLLFV